ncbi:hypothetical protein [Aurantiacibacter odishensis]|uniref:hypothetical protein n=1 Tax=Aurantiacibacter odishensis TaxID=1155476 RepID=UPI000E759140|nr:hypothetical protein [Aurantiacibacter odishensis]
MDRNEALASLDAVRHTRGKLAQRSQWPLWRHALFGLLEATFIFGVSLPFAGMIVCVMIAAATMAWIIHDDKKRYGMFVSGWQGTRPKLVLFGLVAVAGAMAVVSFTARGEPAPSPTALLAASVTFVACTLGSLWWQKLYRQELSDGGAA